MKAQGPNLSILKAQPLDCNRNGNMSATRIGAIKSQQQNLPGKEDKLCKVWKDGKWHVLKDNQNYKDPSAQASFSLDQELQDFNPGNNLMSSESTVEFTKFDQETMPQYYSFNDTIPENTSAQWGDARDVFETKGSTEAAAVFELVEKPEACGAENAIFSKSISYHGNSTKWTDLTQMPGEDFSHGMESDRYHSMIDDDQVHLQTSINASVPRSTCDTPVSQQVVNQTVDSSSDFRAHYTFTQATEIDPDFCEKPTQDTSTATGSSLVNYDQVTQTVQKVTWEKSTLTEVYMSDLDAICEVKILLFLDLVL